ncbi:MAG TPA: hypothetical protein VHC21_00925 [Candidatus Saccharimonadales bacterium]|nr:hypothetical protein [Candidatus Saccharimonadales bacterium]
MVRKILKKAQVGKKVLAEQGVLGFSIVSLQYLQKRTRKAKIVESKGQIYTKARYEDILKADLGKPREAWPGTGKKNLRFNWVMPPPGKGSGGHLNIFRFIKFLEDAGHECRIYMYAPGSEAPVGAVKAIMGDSYPELRATKEMSWLYEDTHMQPAEGIFATSWETAYPVFNSKQKAMRFYFVQDFEPYFYPAGSFYALAENTYKMGFYGITAGGWLSKKLSSEYGMPTEHYDFGSDKTLYFYKNKGRRKEILFYVRPYTERRGFEIGIMALDLFHQKHPDYKINLVGWDVSQYSIPFPYTNLKTLELHQLNDLYNRCAAGLVLSFSNMSLLPLELLGSGTIPVVNKADNNVLVSNNEYIAYSADDPIALADTLSQVVSRNDGPTYARKASESAHGADWADSGRKFVSAVEKAVKTHE